MKTIQRQRLRISIGYRHVTACILIVICCMLSCFSPSQLRAEKPVTGTDIQHLYSTALILHQQGQYEAAYQMLISQPQMEYYPAPLLALTADLAFRTGHHNTGFLITEQFETYFPHHPDLFILRLQSRYFQSDCDYVLAQKLPLKGVALTAVGRRDDEVLMRYQHACEAQNWQQQTDFRLEKQTATLAGLPAKTSPVSYTDDSLLAGLCSIFDSPSCLPDNRFALETVSYPVDFLLSEIALSYRKTLPAYSALLTAGTALYSRKGKPAHGLKPFLKARLYHMISPAVGIYAQSSAAQFRAFSAQSAAGHLNQLEILLGMDRILSPQHIASQPWMLPLASIVDRINIELSHRHDFGDTDSQHRYQLTSQMHFHPLYQTRLHIEQIKAVQYAPLGALYGDTTSSGLSVGMQMEISPPSADVHAHGFYLEHIEAEMGKITHQTSRSPFWLSTPYQHQIRHARIKFVFTHQNLLIKPFFGAEIRRSSSENSLLTSSQNAVLFGFSYQIGE